MSERLSVPLPQALHHPRAARRQWSVHRQLRAASRGLVLSGLVYFVVLSGALPMTAGTGYLLLGLATILGITRAARGLWALRVARHLMRGWGARRGIGRVSVEVPGQPQTPPVHHTADQQAIIALTPAATAHPDGIHGQARARGTQLVDELETFRKLLADPALSEVLRRPVAESIARAEDDLGALAHALTALSRADRSEQPDLLEKLAARLEVERPIPAGLYAPA